MHTYSLRRKLRVRWSDNVVHAVPSYDHNGEGCEEDKHGLRTR